jgi:hypothetical protein
MSEADAPGHAAKTAGDAVAVTEVEEQAEQAAAGSASGSDRGGDEMVEVSSLSALKLRQLTLALDAAGGNCNEVDDEMSEVDASGHAAQKAQKAKTAKTQKGQRAPHYLTAACSVLVDGMNVVGSSAPTASDFQRLLALLETFNGKFRLPDSGISGMHAVAILPSWTRRCWGVTGDDIGFWARQLELWGWAYFVDTACDRSSDDKALISFSRRYALPVVTNDSLSDHVLRARREGDREVFEGTLLVLESRIAHAGTRIVGGLDAEVTGALGYRPPAATRYITPCYPPLLKWRDDRAMIAEAWQVSRGPAAVARWLWLMGLLSHRGRPDHDRKIIALRDHKG